MQAYDIYGFYSLKNAARNRQRRLSYDNIILGTAIHYRQLNDKSTVVNSTLLIQIDDSKYSDPLLYLTNASHKGHVSKLHVAESVAISEVNSV